MYVVFLKKKEKKRLILVETSSHNDRYSNERLVFFFECGFFFDSQKKKRGFKTQTMSIYFSIIGILFSYAKVEAYQRVRDLFLVFRKQVVRRKSRFANKNGNKKKKVSNKENSKWYIIIV